jgi:hypothetical protein
MRIDPDGEVTLTTGSRERSAAIRMRTSGSEAGNDGRSAKTGTAGAAGTSTEGPFGAVAGGAGGAGVLAAGDAEARP